MVHKSLALGDELSFTDVPFEINHVSGIAREIKVRGTTSIYYRRKSFNVKPDKRYLFYSDRNTDTLSFKKFYAISLNMDKDYARNTLAYHILNIFGLNIPDHCFASLYLDGSCEGIYMACYPPSDFAIQRCGSPMVLRRGYNAKIRKTYGDNRNSSDGNELKNKFKWLYGNQIRKYQGQALYDSISSRLSLTEYFDWLIFNDIFKNGDYTDEVYFYWNPVSEKFNIIPWDFDDLMMEYPHEGNIARNKNLKNKFIFSCEDRLDAAMAGDPYIYHIYLLEYKHLLEILTAEKLKKVLKEIYNELLPYYMVQEMILPSVYDKYGPTNLAKLKYDLVDIYKEISERMEKRRSEIDAQLNVNP